MVANARISKEKMKKLTIFIGQLYF